MFGFLCIKLENGTGGVSIIPRVFRFTDLIARILGFKDLIGTPFFVRLVNLKTL